MPAHPRTAAFIGTPTMTQPRKISYRAGLLEPINLTSHEKISGALIEFSAVFTQSNYQQLLGGLLDQIHIIELILSGRPAFSKLHLC